MIDPSTVHPLTDEPIACSPTTEQFRRRAQATGEPVRHAPPDAADHGRAVHLSALDRNKAVVRRLVTEVLGAGRVDVIDELYAPQIAHRARAWIEPFLASFSDVEMEVVELIAEDDRVAGRFRCSGTHTGPWLGRAATGRRFERVDEVYVLRLRDRRIVGAWGLEDTLERLTQLGFGSVRSGHGD